MDHVPYNNHETDVTRAAKKNAERIAARQRGGVSIYTAIKVLACVSAAKGIR